MRTLLRVLMHAACGLYLDGPLGLTSYITRPEQATHTQITRQLECTHSQLTIKAPTAQHTRQVRANTQGT